MISVAVNERPVLETLLAEQVVVAAPVAAKRLGYACSGLHLGSGRHAFLIGHGPLGAASQQHQNRDDPAHRALHALFDLDMAGAGRLSIPNRSA